MGALHSAVRHFNEGADPNAAVVKAAMEHDFNADQTTRLVETFNTARTIYHYKTANDRTAEFALANSAAVIPAIFEDVEEKKSEDVVNHDYSSYDLPEANYQDGLEIKGAAGVRDIDLGTPTEFMDTSLETQAERAMRVLHVQRDLAKTARSEARVAATKAADILTKLATTLGRGYEEECQERYNRLVAGYDKQASDRYKDQFGPVMCKLAEFVPGWMNKGAENVDLGPVVDDRDLQEYVGQLKEAKEWMEAESEMLAVAGTLDKEADAFEREWMETIQPVFPEKEADSLVNFIHPGLRKAAQARTEVKTEGTTLFGDPYVKTKTKASPPLLGEAISKGVSGGVQRPISEAIETGVERAVSKPGLEQENIALSERLKNVQRQIMLQDLMANDPVLSEESPDVVVNAYNAVLNLAPELATNKEVVRAILRQAVHSVAIDPYAAQQWTQLEQNIRNIAGKTDFKGRPSEGGVRQ